MTVAADSHNTILAGSAQRAAYSSAASESSAAAAVPARTVLTPPTPHPALANPGSHRGRYVALGAFLVVVVLIAAGVYLPGRKKSTAAADSGSAAVASTPSTPATPENAQPIGAVQNESEAGKSSEQSAEATPDTAAPPKTAVAKSFSPQVSQVPAPPSAPAAPSAAELDEIEHQLDQMFSRAAAVNSSLDRLQQEQARMGLGLRGDIVEKQSAMKDSLAKAQNALEHNDAERARRFATKAEMNLDSLERFLNR
jgi:hypothetical protein